MTDHLDINAIGGLCNRMRAIATACRLASASNRRLRVIWHSNDELRAPFNELFCPLPDDITLYEPSDVEYALKWEMPRKKNLYASALYQTLAYKAVYSDTSNLIRYCGRDEALRQEICSMKGNILIISGLSIGGYDAERMRMMFKPSQAVARIIESRTSRFDAHTVGVHIRRTDNVRSIEDSPLYLFVGEMERILRQEPLTRFFLATDDAGVMRELTGRFGDKLICGDDNVSRDTLRGMMHATADLWALASTSRILGSFYSSFTDLAAVLGDIPLRIMVSPDCRD